jgi:hypothetical protein
MGPVYKDGSAPPRKSEGEEHLEEESLNANWPALSVPCWIRVLKKGVAGYEEREGKARPIIPSAGVSCKELEVRNQAVLVEELSVDQKCEAYEL